MIADDDAVLPALGISPHPISLSQHHHLLPSRPPPPSTPQSLYEDMPSLPAGVKHISDLPEAARRQYAAATSRMEGLMNRMKVDADHTLKNMGWRDKTFAEAVRDNITSAWHDFKVGLVLLIAS